MKVGVYTKYKRTGVKVAFIRRELKIVSWRLQKKDMYS